MSSSTRTFTQEQASRYNSETLDAITKLERMGIPRGADFFTLNRSRVELLLEAADLMRYRRPKNANGSRARCFHEMLQRRARRGNMPEWVSGCEVTKHYRSRRERLRRR